MTQPFFERYARIVLAGEGPDAITVPIDFDFTFTVKRGNTSEPNSAQVSVFNLTETKRSAASKEYSRIWIDAGYNIEPINIFAGNITHSSSGYAGADYLTTIEATDGGLAYSKGSINTSYPPNTSIKEIVRRLVAEGLPNVTVGRIVGLDDVEASPYPYIANGLTTQRLNEIARSYDARWSIENEVFEMVRDDRAGATAIAYVLSADTGMVGSPRVTEKGLQVKSMLNGRIKPNDLIAVDSKTLSPNRGIYKVVSVTHKGSTFQKEYYTEIDCVRAPDGTVELTPDTDQATRRANS